MGVNPSAANQSFSYMLALAQWALYQHIQRLVELENSIWTISGLIKLW